MPAGVEELLIQLLDKNNSTAYGALRALEELSEESAQVYPYMERFAGMLNSESPYVRTRGLTLIAHNAKWDTDNKVDEIIDAFLEHIADPKPVAARQCIKLLPMLAKYKPGLREDIAAALLRADPSRYSAGMRPLVSADIQKALTEIGALSDQ